MFSPQQVYKFDLTTLHDDGAAFVDTGVTLSEGRAGHACAMYDGKPTVVGGFNADGDVLQMEAFDGSAWETLASPVLSEGITGKISSMV